MTLGLTINDLWTVLCNSAILIQQILGLDVYKRQNQVTVKTGGKLYIAGEYSVLTAGQTALIQFIPIFMSAEVKEAPSTQLSSDMFDYSVGREPDANYALIQEALNTLEAFCGEKLPALDLSITGKLERDGVKFGIGSSRCV